MSDVPHVPALHVSLLRVAVRIAVLVALAWAMHLLLGVAMDRIDRLPPGAQGAARIGVVGVLLVLYALLIAVPFVPGVEIGIALMMLGGAAVAPAVYAATVAGLMAAFLAGWYLPHATLIRFFADLRLRGACRLVAEIGPLSGPRRLALLRRRLPGRLGAAAVRFRYLTLALLLNLPGNAVLGGGGGICLVAGTSRLFGWKGTLATLALATAPVPLAVWLFGAGTVVH